MSRRKPKEPKQAEIPFKRWGGPRPGAGRKPSGPRAGVPHHQRPALASRFPAHVTLRVRPHVWNLRTRRCFNVIAEAFAGVRGREGFRLVHYSIQGNHLHLIVEAADAARLGAAMKAVSVRIALGLNRLMERRGAVFADRYHVHVLRSPAECRSALAYVLHNTRRHAGQSGRPVGTPGIDPYSSGASFDGWAPDTTVEAAGGGAHVGESGRDLPPSALTSPAGTWLLAVGWRRHGRIRLDEVPGSRGARKAGGRARR